MPDVAGCSIKILWYCLWDDESPYLLIVIILPFSFDQALSSRGHDEVVSPPPTFTQPNTQLVSLVGLIMCTFNNLLENLLYGFIVRKKDLLHSI